MGKSLPYLFLDGNLKLVPVPERRGSVAASAAAWASVALGVVGAAFCWLPLMRAGPEYLLFVFGFGGMASLVGACASIGLILKKERYGREVAGFYGMLLGLGTIIMGAALFSLGQFVLR
jgi:hypothetical protein